MWCDAFVAFPIMWFADMPEKLQTRRRPLVEAAAEYGVAFITGSLETQQSGGETCRISMADDRGFANRAQVEVLGVAVDENGSTLAASLARAKAAMGAWLKRHRQLCCKRMTLADRLRRLYPTAEAAFSFGAGGDPIQRRRKRPRAHMRTGGRSRRPDSRAQLGPSL